MHTIARVAVAATFLVGCNAPSNMADADAELAARLTDALCVTVAAADEPSAVVAFGSSHEDLHALARTLQERDLRADAASLLEAKQQVEAAVTRDATLDELSPHLYALDRAARDALTALGQTPKTCD